MERSRSEIAAAAVSVLAAADSDLRGFNRRFTDVDCGNLVPKYLGAQFGKVLRFAIYDCVTISVLGSALADVVSEGFVG